MTDLSPHTADPARAGVGAVRGPARGRARGRGSASAGAATLPGFQESVVFSGLDSPTALRFSPDGRVFVAEKSGLIKVFDSLSRPDADRVRRPAHRGLQLLGPRPARPRARPATSRPTPYVYVLYTYDAAIGGPTPRWGTPGAIRRRLPDAAGPDHRRLRGQRPALAADRDGQRDDRLRAGADRRLVPAVPEPLDRRPRVRRRTAPSTSAAATGASFNFADYGQVGDPVNPCGDPAGRRGRRRRRRPAPRAARCAARSPRRPAGEPAALNGADPAGRPGDRQRPARQPARRELRRQRPAHRRLRPAQPVPVHDPARDERALDRRRRLDRRGRRSTASSIRARAPAQQLRLALLRGPGPTAVLPGRRACDSCSRSTRRRRRSRAPYYTYQHSAKVVPGETLPDGQLVDHRARLLPNGGAYPAAYDGALFFADYSRDCIWAMQTGSAEHPGSPNHVETFVAGAANPVDLQIGPDGDLYYVDFDGGTIHRIRLRARQPAADRGRQGRRRPRAARP